MDKPIVEYDLTKGVFNGPYGSIFVWPIKNEDISESLTDWIQLESVLEHNKDNNHIETTECNYVPYNEDEENEIII